MLNKLYDAKYINCKAKNVINTFVISTKKIWLESVKIDKGTDVVYLFQGKPIKKNLVAVIRSDGIHELMLVYKLPLKKLTVVTCGTDTDVLIIYNE